MLSILVALYKSCEHATGVPEQEAASAPRIHVVPSNSEQSEIERLQPCAEGPHAQEPILAISSNGAV